VKKNSESQPIILVQVSTSRGAKISTSVVAAKDLQASVTFGT